MIDYNGNYNEDEHDDISIAELEQDLPQKIREKKKHGILRNGYTTGTSATASTKAALTALLSKIPLKKVSVTLPKGSNIIIDIKWTRMDESGVTCAVIKDGGDDPDVTHGAEICSSVELTDHVGLYEIEGGEGVGRVTKPGLGLPIGSAAINPVPRKMINQAIIEVLELNPEIKQKHGIKVIISVPNGEEIAKRTDNPRLGILGGVSILGTTGIVLPYSTASFAASIRQSLDVGLALNANTFILTTGGRSEDYSKLLFGQKYPDHCYVQMGDFAGYSIKQCQEKKVNKVYVAGFIGKLTKIAMGVKQTHVRGSHVDMEFMAKLALECNASEEIIESIKQANTARHVSEIVDSYLISGYYDLVCKYAYNQLNNYSRGEMSINLILFDFEGRVIGKYPTI